MDINNSTVGVPVKNMKEAKSWYSTFLGDRKTIQPVPKIFEYEISNGFWLQLIEDESLKPGDGAIRFGVTDIKAEQARIKSQGLKISEIQEIPGVIFLCRLTDPFGNNLSLYQEI